MDRVPFSRVGVSGRAGKKISLVSLIIHKIVSASFECIYRLNNPIYVSLKCFYRFSFLFHFIQPNNKLQFQFLTFLISFRLVSFAFGFATHTVCSKKQLPAICMLPVDQVKPKPVALLLLPLFVKRQAAVKLTKLTASAPSGISSCNNKFAAFSFSSG